MLRNWTLSETFECDFIFNAVDRLLSEAIDSTRARERSEFDRIAAERAGQIVLFGAGNLGRQALKALNEDRLRPVAIADNSRQVWGRDLNGMTILSPRDAADRFGATALFVVTIWNDRQRFAETAAMLGALGCRTVVASPPLRWKYQARIPVFPFFFLDLPSKILGVIDGCYSSVALVGQ